MTPSRTTHSKMSFSIIPLWQITLSRMTFSGTALVSQFITMFNGVSLSRMSFS
jgi:hypothetical protein